MEQRSTADFATQDWLIILERPGREYVKASALEERPTMDGDLDRLESVARDRWGESWTIHVTRWADGSQQAFAFHSHGLANPDADDDLYERERLTITDGDRYHVRREIYRQEDVVEVIDEKEGRVDE